MHIGRIIYNQMKSIIKDIFIILMACVTIVLTGCGKECEVPVAEDAAEITVELSPQTLMTRTQLDKDPVYGFNYQHVTYVQLYVFKEQSDGYVCEQSIDVNWVQPQGCEQYQRVTLKLLPGNYKLLAVGLDRSTDAVTGEETGSGKTYGLPENIVLGSSFDDAVAGLDDGATYRDIAQSELFAGSEDVTVEDPKKGLYRTIKLNRRVAGVMMYISNMPASTAEVAVRLYQKQNTKVILPDREDGNYCVDNSMSGDEGAEYIIRTGLKADGTAVKGAYLLPLEAPAGTDACTMFVEALDSSGRTLGVRRVLKQEKNSSPVSVYPIEDNNLYCIGTEEDYANFGDDVVIIVDGAWEDIYDFDGQ